MFKLSRTAGYLLVVISLDLLFLGVVVGQTAGKGSRRGGLPDTSVTYNLIAAHSGQCLEVAQGSERK